MCSDDPHKNDIKELLEWELSLESRDLRSHGWYHGNITRQTAESLLLEDGDFLVRDCSSSGNPGDTVLSCRWKNNNLHFLVHKDVLQKDTIYEQLRYRFEFQSFDTVADLITYHVGSAVPISSCSGAFITNPKSRAVPITGGHQDILHGIRSDYVTLQNFEPVPAFSYLDKVSTLERINQPALNLVPPAGLLEDLEDIPQEIVNISLKLNENDAFLAKGSNFDLAAFDSILFPTCSEDIRLDSSLLDAITTNLLETSETVLALHITKLDWDVLSGNAADNGSSDLKQGLYSLYFHNSQHRWNNVIERSLTMSQFVVLTITCCNNSEEMLNKWMNVAGELKASFGNSFSFCSIMRGLLMPEITRTDGKINWMKLRSEYTEATFNFETSQRSTFQGLCRGSEPYPPNTGIPELLSGALILDDALELLPISCIAGEEDQLTFMTNHLNELRNLSKWEDIQKRNLERHFEKDDEFDIVLTDIFRTELHLMLIWGQTYNESSLKSRCENFDKLLAGL